MAQPFSNKVHNPLFDINSALGIAHTTPMLNPAMQKVATASLVPLPQNKQKASAQQSTTPAAQTDPTSLGAYKGVPIKYGDQAFIEAQIRAIDGNASGAKTPLIDPRGVSSNISTTANLITPTGGSQPSNAVRGIIAPPKGKEQEVPSFSGILYELIKKATEGDKGVQKAREDLTKFQTATSDKIAAIRSEPIALEFQQGRAQAVQQASAEKEKAYQTGVENALTSQGQTLGALNQAAGLASPQQLGSGNVYIDPATGQPIAGGPTQVPYTNQFLNPLTGQSVGGGIGGGNKGLDVDSVAQQVVSGQMSPTQAYSTFGNNLAFNNAINQAITKSNPGFNFIQAEANASAQGQALQQATLQGTNMQKRADTVTQHLNTLRTTMNDLGRLNIPVVGNIPIANTISNFVGQQLGNKDLKAFQTALSNARGELAGIFAIGGTPTEGEAMAKIILPDNITPDQLETAITTAQELVQSKVNEYSNIGNVPQFGNGGTPTGGSTGGGGTWDW